MDEKSALQSRYYQTIAREFLRRRGAPFSLSPRDLTVVAEWEARGVPLGAVLEGIAAAFDRMEGRPRQGKIRALSFCAGHVERAWCQHRERRAGRRRPGAGKADKKALARREAERFLGSEAAADKVLGEIFGRGLTVLSSSSPDEKVLEALDEAADAALWSGATGEEREAWRRTARKTHGRRSAEEIDEIARIMLVKALREKRKIPYCSLFYY